MIFSKKKFEKNMPLVPPCESSGMSGIVLEKPFFQKILPEECSCFFLEGHFRSLRRRLSRRHYVGGWGS